jgi:hypothetical protein
MKWQEYIREVTLVVNFHMDIDKSCQWSGCAGLKLSHKDTISFLYTTGFVQ